MSRIIVRSETFQTTLMRQIQLLAMKIYFGKYIYKIYVKYILNIQLL